MHKLNFKCCTYTRMYAFEHYAVDTFAYNAYCFVYIFAIVWHNDTKWQFAWCKVSLCSAPNHITLNGCLKKHFIIFTLRNTHEVSCKYWIRWVIFPTKTFKKCEALETIFMNIICTGQRERETETRVTECKLTRAIVDESAVHCVHFYLFLSLSFACHLNAIKYKYANSNTKSDDKSLLFQLSVWI